MTSEELLKKVRKIEIKTRSLSRNIFAGEYHSQFKGRGMTFSEVREYQPGDDVRSIDWNVTAKLNKPYIKVFEEERELTVMLLVDVSGSRNFGTQSQMKRDMMAEIAATLAFSTIANNDKVGVIFFTDKIEKYIPPKKGRKHVLHIIRELIDFEPTSAGTDIACALHYFTNAQKRHCTAFLISDLCLPLRGEVSIKSTEKPLLIASNKHDISVIQVYDYRDAELPAIGLLKLKDAESGERIWVDTSEKQVRNDYATNWRRQQSSWQEILTKTGTRNISLRTDEDYVKALMKLFRV
ncbi:MAG: DUF58 domain-containing protein [Paludibacter sp.]|nr:DUF58 domain-containing protein [Bacteroidales bacterium]MCM1068923.1 DUF58 domain-containing protein [Prevotella sp.]MCM1353184.1 DUF58 domain-containing protein [Bacteroides sp.]MCM1442506.1 DUF58 domain-containing protein [Muribaculum sp.]MCM1481349.1 DUF58 domain-containing protein [Paludibacter sp.]